MERGPDGRAPDAAPLIDPVPLPAVAAGEDWQHVLLESGLRQARKWRATLEPTRQSWVWALLLSCPRPIDSFDAMAALPHGSIVTALLGGELRDRADLRDVVSPSTGAGLAGLQFASDRHSLTLSVRDGTFIDGVCLHLSNDPDLDLRSESAVAWAAFVEGRSGLLAKLGP